MVTVFMCLSPSSRTREFLWARKRGPFLSSALDVFAYRLSRCEVEPDAPMLVAFLVKRNRRLITVLVKVAHFQRQPVPILAPE